MKKILLLSALVLFGAHKVMATGTVQFQNTITSTFTTNNGSVSGRVSNVPFTMAYGIFYSDFTTGGVSNNLIFGGAVYNAIAPAAGGIIAGNAQYPLPGVSDNDQVWLMILGWDGSLGLNGYTNYIGAYGSGSPGPATGQWNGAGKYFLQTHTILVTTGPDQGPGTVIFGTRDASHFGVSDLVFFVPEPTSCAMVLSGSAMLYYFRRRKR